MRSLILATVVVTIVVLDSAATYAVEPKAVALEAIATLLVEHDVEKFKTFVSEDAVQGSGQSGSALLKIAKQTPELLQMAEVSEIIFFKKADIEDLAKQYPDDLWQRVEGHILEDQGVLVRLTLIGEAAKRVAAAGKNPKNIAMMTFVLEDSDASKIVHIDDN